MESWRCHVCGKERPDDKISVLSKPIIINEQFVGEQNVRYCNDDPSCMAGAERVDFLKKKEDV